MPGHRFTFGQRKCLKRGDWLDVLDPFRVWCKARILDVVETDIHITYLGWDSKWDEWIDAASPRIQPWGSFTGSRWTGGPDHPFGPLPGIEVLIGPLTCREPSPLIGRSRPFWMSGHSRPSIKRSPKKYLPRLVMDDDDHCLSEDWCCDQYESPDENQVYGSSDEDMSCGGTRKAGDDDELCASAEDSSEIYPPLDCNDDRNDNSVPLEAVKNADSFSLISEKCSENSSWVAEGYYGSEAPSVTSEFDVISLGSTVSEAPQVLSEFPLGNGEWEMLQSTRDEALVDHKPSSTPYRNALLKKGPKPFQLGHTSSKSMRHRNRTVNGKLAEIGPSRVPLARIAENNNGEAEAREENHDEPGSSDWLEELRDQVKQTAGGRLDRRYKGSTMKAHQRK